MIEDNKIWPKGAPEIGQKAELTAVTRDDGMVALDGEALCYTMPLQLPAR